MTNNISSFEGFKESKKRLFELDNKLVSFQKQRNKIKTDYESLCKEAGEITLPSSFTKIQSDLNDVIANKVNPENPAAFLPVLKVIKDNISLLQSNLDTFRNARKTLEQKASYNGVSNLIAKIDQLLLKVETLSLDSIDKFNSDLVPKVLASIQKIDSSILADEKSLSKITKFVSDLNDKVKSEYNNYTDRHGLKTLCKNIIIETTRFLEEPNLADLSAEDAKFRSLSKKLDDCLSIFADENDQYFDWRKKCKSKDIYTEDSSIICDMMEVDACYNKYDIEDISSAYDKATGNKKKDLSELRATLNFFVALKYKKEIEYIEQNRVSRNDFLSLKNRASRDSSKASKITWTIIISIIINLVVWMFLPLLLILTIPGIIYIDYIIIRNILD